MSDRTAYTIAFKSYDHSKKEELQEYLDGVLGANDSGISFETYIGTDVRVGQIEEIAEAIGAIDPTAVFRAWEDPCYEWLGDVVIRTRDETFRADCDSRGTVVWPYDVVKSRLDQGLTLEQIFGEGLIPDE